MSEDTIAVNPDKAEAFARAILGAVDDCEQSNAEDCYVAISMDGTQATAELTTYRSQHYNNE